MKKLVCFLVVTVIAVICQWTYLWWNGQQEEKALLSTTDEAQFYKKPSAEELQHLQGRLDDLLARLKKDGVEAVMNNSSRLERSEREITREKLLCLAENVDRFTVTHMWRNEMNARSPSWIVDASVANTKLKLCYLPGRDRMELAIVY